MTSNRKKLAFALFIFTIAVVVCSTLTRGAQAQTDKPFVAEYYYKAKWGHADEFITLFKKNHYPVLKKEIELGRILQVHADQPRYHTTEDGRWDYRITIVFKNAAIANDNFDASEIIKQLYPDQDTRKRNSAASKSSMPTGTCL